MAEWNAASGDARNFGDDGTPGKDDFANEGNGASAGGPDGDVTCRSCNQVGHFARECPDKPPMVCRACDGEGHFAKECPNRPPQLCKNCGQEGHIRQNCDNARVISRDHIATVDPEVAWAKIKQAVAERDVEDAKEAVQEYMKAMNGAPTYRELQEGLIGTDVSLWFIAAERDLLPVFTNMDLQGNMGKKYSISYRFSEKPERPREVEGWPQSRDEILSRLDDAGEPTNSGKSRCGNCGEVGHIAKDCEQEKEEREKAKISCYNCNGEGHRVRDCPQPRVDRDACRNCGQSGHRANDCEEPPNPANIECRKCNETGHFAKDCPTGGGSFACRNCGNEGHKAADCDQPRNMDNVTCRNCEKTGHVSRDCPEPKDWSKVQCSNCQEYGHTKVRCKKPPTESEGGGGYDNAGYGATTDDFKPSGGGGGDWQGDTATVSAGGDGW